MSQMAHIRAHALPFIEFQSNYLYSLRFFSPIFLPPPRSFLVDATRSCTEEDFYFSNKETKKTFRPKKKKKRNRNNIKRRASLSGRRFPGLPAKARRWNARMLGRLADGRLGAGRLRAKSRESSVTSVCETSRWPKCGSGRTAIGIFFNDQAPVIGTLLPPFVRIFFIGHSL